MLVGRVESETEDTITIYAPAGYPTKREIRYICDKSVLRARAGDAVMFDGYITEIVGKDTFIMK